MLSIIMPMHNEPLHILPMLNRIEKHIYPIDLEVIIVTSAHGALAYQKEFPFPIRNVCDIHGSGTARNEGASEASGDSLLFMDSHCCFTDLSDLLELSAKNPDAIIAPGVQPNSFPECVPNGSGVGYGCYFTPSFDWHWIGKQSSPFEAPFCSACFMLMKKRTFEASVIGFIPVDGVGFEEELCMRLHRLGHPTLIDVNTTVGHLFKKSYPQESTAGFVPSRAIAAVISVLDDSLFSEINNLNSKRWGNSWLEAMESAHRDFDDLRETFKAEKVIDEHWFFR